MDAHAYGTGPPIISALSRQKAKLNALGVQSWTHVNRPQEGEALEVGPTGGVEFQHVYVETFPDWVINSSHFLSTQLLKYTQ